MFENAGRPERPMEELHTALVGAAGQMAAAMCRYLADLAELDRRGGWGAWECRSAAHWLAWRCGVDLPAAWEQVRVARRLAELPVITEAFSRGELSYFQVRALVRVATAETEESLAEIARHSTGPQLVQLVRAYRGVLEAQANLRAHEAHGRRHLRYFFDEDGFFVIKGRLSPEDGKLIEGALEAVAAELRAAHRRSDLGDARADQPPGAAEYPRDANRADALVALAETALARGLECRSGADRTQVVVHVDAATLSGHGPGEGQDHCELEDGPALAPEVARRLSCDAALVTLVEDDEGHPLSVGRKTRKIPPALQRALRARDGGCRFPGCSQRRFVEGHHIQHWAAGGETSLANLVQLCWFHHRLVHEGGYRLQKGAEGGLSFFRPNGTPIERVPRTGGPHGGKLAFEVDPSNTLSRWTGERMNYGYVTGGLALGDSRLRERPEPGEPEAEGDPPGG